MSWKVCGFLVSCWPEPLDGRCLVGDKSSIWRTSLTLMRFLSYSAACSGQEIHAFTRGEALLQAGVEFDGGQRNRHTALDVEGHHAVEKQEVLALGDDLGTAVLETNTGNCRM